MISTEDVAGAIIDALSLANDDGTTDVRTIADPDDEMRSGGTFFTVEDPATGHRFDIVVSRADQ
jgi:hypothetical protein